MKNTILLLSLLLATHSANANICTSVTIREDAHRSLENAKVAASKGDISKFELSLIEKQALTLDSCAEPYNTMVLRSLMANTLARLAMTEAAYQRRDTTLIDLQQIRNEVESLRLNCASNLPVFARLAAAGDLPKADLNILRQACAELPSTAHP